MIVLCWKGDRTFPVLENILLDHTSVDLGVGLYHLRGKEVEAIIHQLQFFTGKNIIHEEPAVSHFGLLLQPSIPTGSME